MPSKWNEGKKINKRDDTGNPDDKKNKKKIKENWKKVNPDTVKKKKGETKSRNANEDWRRKKKKKNGILK